MTGRHRADRRSGRSGRWHLWVPAAALSGLLLAGAAISWNAGQPSGSEAPDEPAGSSVAPVAASTQEHGSEDAAPERQPGKRAAGKGEGQRRARDEQRDSVRAAAGTPVHVVIEALTIEAPVVPIVSDGQSLDPPPDPQVLGWWSDGARPGAARGTALVVGHTVHDGGGALDDLERLGAGADVRLRTDRGTIDYVVETVAVLDKDTIARRASQLFSQEVDGRLVLVTCEGWDGTGYRSNVVVTATPT